MRSRVLNGRTLSGLCEYSEYDAFLRFISQGTLEDLFFWSGASQVQGDISIFSWNSWVLLFTSGLKLIMRVRLIISIANKHYCECFYCAVAILDSVSLYSHITVCVRTNLFNIPSSGDESIKSWNTCSESDSLSRLKDENKSRSVC